MSTLNQPSASDLSHELVATFGAFGPSYMKWMTAEARSQGITYARLKTLHALQHGGSKIMSGLRDELGVTARSVTALVDALEAEDLVRRVPHPTDRRATIIELTERGHGTAEGLFEAHRERAAKLFAQLDEDDQRHLLRILRTLSSHLEAMGVELGWGPSGPPSGGVDACGGVPDAGVP